MGLNDIELSSEVVARYYGKTIVGEPKTAIKSVKEKKINALGHNERHILIIISNEQDAFLQESHLDLLVKILGACQLGLKDIALVNCCNHSVDYAILSETFKPVKIILFGVDLASLSFPLSFPEYQVQKYHSQTLLLVPSLEAMAGDDTIKRNVWDSLKKMFL